MTGILRRATQYLLSLALMGAFLYWSFREVDAAAMWATMRSLPGRWVVAIILTTLCTLALRSWRWQVLLRPFAPQVTLADAATALSICYAANVAIPRSGEVLRTVSLRWSREVRVSSALATVVVERILDVVWLVLFLAASALLVRGRLEQAFPGLGSLSVVALIGSLVALALLAFVSLRREQALAIVERWLGKVAPGVAARVGELLDTFLKGLEALHSPAAYAEIALSSVLLNVGYVLIIYEAFVGFGFTDTYALGADAALVIMVIASIGVIFPTPGAAGTYHAFFGKALIHLYAVSQTDAMACATAVHAVATLTYLCLGTPAFLWQRRRHGGRS